VSNYDEAQSANTGIGANNRTCEMVGGCAVLGTLMGPLAGGGKGAAIGAVAGAVVGGAVQVLTRGDRVKVPAETELNFRLDRPLHLEPV
jgi:outer membrane lipoprotein SlyB